MIPHLFPQFLVGLVLLFPHAILHESSITFLGFGLSNEQPAIGIILSEAMKYLTTGKWWLLSVPLVPQSTAYLDPLMKVGPQICKGKKDPDKKKRLDSIFAEYSLDKSVQQQYPFELSGGMTRRIMISTALIENPRLVIADEPTPGLDPALSRKAMKHFRQLADMGAAVLVITHNLELALETTDRIQIFYAGYSIEDAAVRDFEKEETLRHPYTKALWRAMPKHGFHYIGGTQPYASEQHEPCPFAPRCDKYTDKCRESVPWRLSGNGYVRCIYDT